MVCASERRTKWQGYHEWHQWSFQVIVGWQLNVKERWACLCKSARGWLKAAWTQRQRASIHLFVRMLLSEKYERTSLEFGLTANWKETWWGDMNAQALDFWLYIKILWINSLLHGRHVVLCCVSTLVKAWDVIQRVAFSL